MIYNRESAYLHDIYASAMLHTALFEIDGDDKPPTRQKVDLTQCVFSIMSKLFEELFVHGVIGQDSSSSQYHGLHCRTARSKALCVPAARLYSAV